MKKLHLYQAIFFFILFFGIFFTEGDLFSFTLVFLIGHFYMYFLFKIGRRFFVSKGKISTFSIIIIKWFLIGGIFAGILPFLEIKVSIIALSSMISFWFFLSLFDNI